MKTVFIIRNFPSKRGVFGSLMVPEHGKNWYSLENPDLENKVNISCIPATDYICRWTYSNRLKRYTYQIMNVRARTGIRFHPFNVIEETEGCTGLGEKIKHTGTETRLVDSRVAIKAFEKLMDKKAFKLKIRWCVGFTI